MMLAAASSVHTVRWANAFAAHGHEVHLVSLQQPLPTLDDRIRVYPLAFRAGAGYLLNIRRLRQLVRSIRPEVINAHYATGYGTMARQVTDTPIVLNVWGSDVFAFPDKGLLHREWLKRNLLHADHIVSTSQVMADRVRTFTQRTVPVTVVPFGVDTTRFTPAGAAPERSAVVIGTVKALEPVYGIDLLIKAFSSAMDQHPELDLRLRITGAGSQREALMELAQQRRIADRVTFVGPLAHDQVPEELQRLDVFAALSRSESFGVAVVEAQSCGLPVVVSNVGGLPEVVLADRTGFIVPAEDHRAAAAKLVQLATSHSLRRSLGEAGRAHVLQHFDWTHCVDRMIAVLEATAQHRPVA